MGKIKILDTFTSNKIAAGEVIERPSSVVKELIENSIDAKASFIQVEIKDGGTTLIKVTDNGSGMDKDDALIAFNRHATSKIYDSSDLDNISTFGFRGEALSSIAAVSQIILNTSTGDQVGTQIKIMGGELDNIKEVAFAQGTSIEIRNIFYNIPARRKFIKGLSYETGLITELITKYSLGHPHIRFKVINNKNIIYDTAGKNTTKSRLKEVFGEELGSKFIYSEDEVFAGSELKAWLAPKEFSKSTRNQQLFFINGRLIKSKELSKSLEDAYHTFLPKGRFPIALLDFTLPFNELDVNIHPTKLNVKIYNLDFLVSKLTSLIKDTLNKTNLIEFNDYIYQNLNDNYASEDNNFLSMEEENIPVKAIFKEPEINYYQDDFNLKDSLLDPINIKPEKDIAKPEEQFIHFREKDKQASFTENTEVKVKDIPNLKPLAQLNDTFILAQNQEGLFIIDQHTCHERILYERFMKEDAEKTILSESLLIPITLNLTAKQEGILIKNILTLNKLGFIVEHFGTRAFVIRALPLDLKIKNIEQFFLDLIDEIGEYSKNNYNVLREKVLIMASCKGAIKAKQKLNNEEILFLLSELAKVDNPHTCPHGRPIIHHISMKHLYKTFRRGEFNLES
ncbi:DNA mismatch repair protein MutL [Desulfonispora thiosulfatigenes DSM 11270]|uniref:DNA mismatch repair protein MutL n=1 Tax=Desulfonispora thiosulfatigenes DSM 11270 TaxID=656914 RepID=A0A1W1VNZ5_DESTI|nr:DNA mismatch repair endonuclease MutL [Desulfonispora thiosulfatigenes]SMB95095.1 DNA mismatch repair protein MutL [Desulfonispora thiosulfatigenes DSM 11270]